MELTYKDALRRARVALVSNLDLDIIYKELLGKDMLTPPLMKCIEVSFLSMVRMIN